MPPLLPDSPRKPRLPAMRIAIFGDIHLYALRVKPWDLLSKRALGQTNLWLNRRKRFDPSRVEPMVERIEAMKPDLVLSPGDFTTTALPREFEMAEAALGPFLRRHQALVIPGNHDRYTFRASRAHRFERWFADHTPPGYPHHDDHRGLHVVALNAARPNRLFDRGEVGDRQMRALAGLLRHIPGGEPVLVLCHYTLGPPPGGPDESPRHRMVDEGQLLDILKLADRPLVYVHGHVHRPWLFQPKAAPNVLVLNAGSPTHLSHDEPLGQGFWTLDWSADQPLPRAIQRHVPLSETEWQSRSIHAPSAPGESAAI